MLYVGRRYSYTRYYLYIKSIFLYPEKVIFNVIMYVVPI